MTYKVTNTTYDLQQRRVSIVITENGPDNGFASVSFNLHVPPETPEHELRHQIEEQARRVLREASEFLNDPAKAQGT